MAGVDTIRGIAFQLAQTLSDVVDLVVDGEGDAVVIEGAADVVDYEILDRDGRRIAVRQAKTRREPGTWGARELAAILCAWGEVDNASEVTFAFVTDASLNDSGRHLHELIRDMQVRPDETVLRQAAATLAPGGIKLPPLDVVQRVQILTRMGTTDRVLGQAEMRVLMLLSRARLATLDDAQNAVSALFRRLFIVGGSVVLSQRTVSRADVLAALGLTEASLQGGAAWSHDTAAAYRASVLGASRRPAGFVPLDVMTVASVPRVLRLLGGPREDRKGVQSLDTVLDEQAAALVGATGQGKTRALRYLAGIAAQRELLPVELQAAGHTPGTLPRRIRHSVETRLGKPLTAGAVQYVLADPGLLLLIDGASEADPDARAALSADLQKLSAQRPVRLVAGGRDLPLTIGAVALPDTAAVFRIAGLDHGSRRQLAAEHGGSEQAVSVIERHLANAVDNPMLFLMALSLSDSGVPGTRAEVYQQFLRGLTARARVSDDDISMAALGVAWVQLIGRDLRAADHYTWRSILGGILDQLATLPAWRGHVGTAETALAVAQRTGLLTRLDPDSGLAPLHDSFADFLAARAIACGEASLPAPLHTGYDETVLFMVEMAGFDDALVIRLATDNPLLACRVAQLPQARGRADAEQVSRLLRALAAGRDLPLLTRCGVRLCRHKQFTGAVLAGEGDDTVDSAEFEILTRDHPAVMMPVHTGSLELAVRLWATAVERAFRPSTRVFRPAPPADAEAARVLLPAHLREVEQEMHRLAGSYLPSTVSERVLAVLGPQGVIAYVGDPVPGHLGGLEVPVRYRRGAEYVVTRCHGQPPDDTRLVHDSLAGMMRRHPAVQAAYEISQALSALTGSAWPKP